MRRWSGSCSFTAPSATVRRPGARSSRSASATSSTCRTGPGFPPGPPVERVDFEADADWLVERLRPGDHLCGHSYGGVICLLAAAQYPEVGSLTVIEPPATRVAPATRRPMLSPPVRSSSGATARASRRRSCGRSFARSARPGSRPPRSRPTLERGRADPDGRARSVGGGDSARRAARAPVPEARRLGRTPSGLRRGLRRARAGARARSESSSPARATPPSARPASTRRSSEFLARARTRLTPSGARPRLRSRGAARERRGFVELDDLEQVDDVERRSASATSAIPPTATVCQRCHSPPSRKGMKRVASAAPASAAHHAHIVTAARRCEKPRRRKR